jgi:hypothetical protein
MKALVWFLVIGLLASLGAVGFLLHDGGYIAKWTGGHEVSIAEPRQESPATPVAKGDQSQPTAQPQAKADPKSDVPRPEQAEGWLTHLSFGAGLAIFGVAIVIGAIIRLLAKFIPTVIEHRKG